MHALPFPKPKGRERNTEYMLAVRRLPCVLLQVVQWPCRGDVEADHVGERPQGRKCDDTETIPICQLHHAQRHHRSGYFKDFDKVTMRAWCARMGAQTRRQIYAAQVPVGQTDDER
jgi:hypothetical protein